MFEQPVETIVTPNVNELPTTAGEDTFCSSRRCTHRHSLGLISLVVMRTEKRNEQQLAIGENKFASVPKIAILPVDHQ